MLPASVPARIRSASPRDLLAAITLGVLLFGFVGWTRAAVGAEPLDVQWGKPAADARYGSGVVFSQPVTSTGLAARAELLLTSPGALGPFAVQVSPAASPVPSTLRYTLSESDGHIVPNTRLHARWRLTDDAGRVAVGPDVAITYSDTRFDWQTKTGSIVRVHWYEGSNAFGARALAIGEKAIKDAAALLGVTETEPVDFFIYADQDAFYNALGPGTRENVGGEAHADIRTMFALITPGEIDATWVGVVVPHELTHLVFDTAVKNPYHFPPRWLNEGLAVYLSEGYTASWRSTVESAVGDGSIMPLDALVGQFPTTGDRFRLAYGESVSAVDYLVRTDGQDALLELINTYAKGVSDDEAFQAALGKDVAAFQAGWLKELGAATPTAIGPQPAPAGPLPSGWSSEPGAAGAAPAETPAASAATSNGSPSSSSDTGWALLIGVAAVVLGVVGGMVAAQRRRRRTDDGG